MLTQSERLWLKKREQWAEPHNGYGDEGYFCEHCKINCFDGCPTEIRDGNIDAFVDAAEFSERVAEKLAQVAAMQKKHHCCVDIDVPFHCPGWQSCAERIMSRKELRPCEFEILKGARFEVEEEMDADIQAKD